MRSTTLVLALMISGSLARADDVIPHAQSKPPGPPLSPAEAIRKMTVPDGFSVELVASEPDIVNPVAMTFDERGRIWITESLEYPRKSAGVGRDRVKVIEDTDGDGKADKFTVFAEGLNIPSGIAVGSGGVWVANSPDILFLQDTDGDGKADRREVVVTGFGRDDTHELPNSLTWGPDGCLYGWNGVFNQAHVEHRGKRYDFTCAIFRINPRTRDFDLFCEGTSNPWGIAWDDEGSAFASACVIDHLWHLTESGYYHRQGGPYPLYAWKIESIADHKHQQAAYCGIHFFDSDAYPPRYRERLFMGNIHGNCINVDGLVRDGSTYKGVANPDFLTANDAWFMPVAEKTGPDGSLYILDWYDRYHCYQDANRDPAGIDRLKGRLYRVRYKDTPRAPRFDLARETDDQLIERLHSPNVYFRDVAQRLLRERDDPATRPKLQALVLDIQAPRKARMHALWALIGTGRLETDFQGQLLAHPDPGYRAWGVRAAGNARKVDATIRDAVVRLARDPSRDVQLQVAIAAAKVEGVDAIPVLVDVLSHSGDDPLIPHIVWQNLHPLLEDRSETFLALIREADPNQVPSLPAMMPLVIERILDRRNPDPAPVANLFAILAEGRHRDIAAAQECLAVLAGKVQTGDLAGAPLVAVKGRLQPTLLKILAAKADGPLFLDAALLATSWKEPAGLEAVRRAFTSTEQPEARRLQALDALIRDGDPMLLDAVSRALTSGSVELRRKMLASLGRLDDPRVAEVVLAAYPRMEPELQPDAVELMTERPTWTRPLLRAIGSKAIPASALNVNQVRKLLGSKDPEIAREVRAHWGSVREERNPEREQVIARMRTFLRRTPGDPVAGQKVFKKVCAECHKIYGEGQEVGPDITGTGRTSFELLLSNVFDPSLVIGSAYQATTVATADGRVLTGLVAEDNDQRIVLKLQGGKAETIPRADVEQIKISTLSLMPEDIEKQYTPREIADLFAFLTLDKPPGDPTAHRLPGSEPPTPRETDDPSRFGEILDEFAPGFSVAASGEGGLALLAEHLGRPGVLRTHPVGPGKPCVLRASFDVPEGKTTSLALAVSHDPRGDWQLVVKANGTTLFDEVVGPKTTKDGWAEVTVDLTRFAGRKVDLEILNQPNGWSFEYAYWGRIEVVSEKR